MPPKFLFSGHIKRPLYAQVLVVMLAFALMIFLSSYYMSNIVRKHLSVSANMALNSVEKSIKADLREVETVLGSISETIRKMILDGFGFDTVSAYMTDITEYFFSNEKFLPGLIGPYAVFYAFDGKFHAGFDWMPPSGYVYQDRPWYKAALEAGDAIGFTEPFLNISANEMALGYVRRIFDDEGRPLAVICLDVSIHRFLEYVVNTFITEGSYGILLNNEFEVIAHPNPAYLGRHLSLVNDSLVIENELRNGMEIAERSVSDYRGNPSILFVRQLENGWYMAVLTPEDHYYREMREMRTKIIVLGIILAFILGTILYRIISEKYMLDAKKIEAEEANKTIYILENILNSLNEMIYVTVPKTGEILFINNVMKKHYNIEGDLTGKLCYKVLQEGLDDICDFCPCHELDKNPEKTIVWIENNPLTNCVYRNTDRYIEWPDGKLVHLQHSVDITELNKAKEQAIEANNAKSKFLAKISHEVRTPMNAILGIAEIQLQDQKLEFNMKDAFSKICNSGYLLLSIINDILDLSKIEAGKLELIPVVYDVASMINDTAHLNVMRYDSKPVLFDVQADENIPSTLLGDELRIKQILNNLLSNAFKYTPNGKVMLSVKSTHTDNDASGQGCELVISVSDTGQGMTQEQLNRMFDEYTRFNSEANRTTEGTGLGMNITRHLVYMMNGRINVESEPGKGSVFTVHLPQGIIDDEKLGKEVAENLKQFRLNKPLKKIIESQILFDYMPYGRILVVDDVETNLYVARGLMAPYGLSIETACSGYEAIDKIKNGASYDLILMDHFMPRMDGMETVRLIRAFGYKGPIAALTANAVTGQAEIFLQNGFDGFISKPIDIRQLNALLNKFVRDIQPPQVLENAQQLKNKIRKPANEKNRAAISPQLASFFIKDAGKAVNILEEITKKGNVYEDEDLQSFIINTHAMKSALANIGEAELSDFAFKLENAGRSRDIAVIQDETRLFINALNDVIGKLKPKDDEITEDDADSQAFLKDRLSAIHSACLEYDRKTAKIILTELRQRTWSLQTIELLDKISGYLLHSDFTEAANASRNL